MIQTLDFIYLVWKSGELRKTLLNNLAESKEADPKEADPKEAELVIGLHTLEFDFTRQTVKISCNEPDYIFYSKMPPVEMSFDALIKLIHRKFDFDYRIL